ncbi:unnamed protein product, partial [Closterium sp. NIES-53]
LGGGAGCVGAALSGGAGPRGASAGVHGVGRAGGTGTGGIGATGGTGGAGPIGASAVVPRVGGTSGADTGGATGGTGVGGARRYLPPAAHEFPISGTTPLLLFPPTVQSQPQLLLGSPLPAPAPHTTVSESFTERREPPSRPVTHVRSRRAVRPRPPPVPGTHIMALRPSSVPQHVVLPSPPMSSLPHLPDPESDLVRTASPTVTRLLATVVIDPSFESAAVSALVVDLVDFATLCRLDYTASLFELECLAAAAPHLASTLIFPEGDPYALDIPTPRTYAEAITGLYSSQWQIARNAEMASWKSTGTYVDEFPPPGANIVGGMWIFRVLRLPLRRMATLWVLLHVAAQREYELHSFEFSTAFLQGSLDEAIWLRRPRGFTGTTLAALGFAPSTADPSLFLRTYTSLPPFYVLVYVDDLNFAAADTEALALEEAELARHTITLTRSYMVQQVLQRFEFLWSSPQPTPLSTGHSLSAPPLDESVEPGGSYLELVGCLITSGMGLVLRGQGSVVLTSHSDASWGDDEMTHRCEAEIYAWAMAAQELRWLTYLLTDLGERPCSPLVRYVDNKAMIVLCRDKRLEHRTKQIALRYFLTRELQQRGQLRLACVAILANIADVFTKALGSSDNQRFCIALGLVPTLPHLLVS